MGKPKSYSSTEHSSDEDSNDADLNLRKRGRGPSKRPCLNRNALMARVNRQKKKQHLEKIENKLSMYKKGNKNLATVIQQQGIDLKRLRAEVAYLRSILNNNTHITALLRTMNETLKQGRSNKAAFVDQFDFGDNCDSRKSLDADSRTSGSPRCLSGLQKDVTGTSGSPRHFPGSSGTPGPLPESSGSLKYLSGSKVLPGSPKLSSGPLGSLESLSDAPGSPKDSEASSGPSGNNEYQALSFVDNDHNYSGISNDLFNFEGVKFDPSGNLMCEDDFEGSGLGIEGLEDMELDSEIFGHNGDLDRFADADLDLFGGLDNSGICLHVNSGRISLEYCAICRLNSINSDDP